MKPCMQTVYKAKYDLQKSRNTFKDVFVVQGKWIHPDVVQLSQGHKGQEPVAAGHLMCVRVCVSLSWRGMTPILTQPYTPTGSTEAEVYHVSVTSLSTSS